MHHSTYWGSSSSNRSMLSPEGPSSNRSPPGTLYPAPRAMLSPAGAHPEEGYRIEEGDGWCGLIRARQRRSNLNGCGKHSQHWRKANAHLFMYICLSHGCTHMLALYACAVSTHSTQHWRRRATFTFTFTFTALEEEGQRTPWPRVRGARYYSNKHEGGGR